MPAQYMVEVKQKKRRAAQRVQSRSSEEERVGYESMPAMFFIYSFV